VTQQFRGRNDKDAIEIGGGINTKFADMTVFERWAFQAER
jgi:hypothetical protein